MHFEPWFVQRREPPAARWGDVDPERAIEGLGDAFQDLARFTGAGEVRVGRVTPSRLAAAVRRAVAASVAARGLTPSSRPDVEPESASAEGSEEEVGTGSEV